MPYGKGTHSIVWLWWRWKVSQSSRYCPGMKNQGQQRDPFSLSLRKDLELPTVCLSPEGIAPLSAPILLPQLIQLWGHSAEQQWQRHSQLHRKSKGSSSDKWLSTIQERYIYDHSPVLRKCSRPLNPLTSDAFWLFQKVLQLHKQHLSVHWLFFKTKSFYLLFFVVFLFSLSTLSSYLQVCFHCLQILIHL